MLEIGHVAASGDRQRHLIAALARGREITISTLVVGVLMGPLLVSVTMNVQQLIFLIGQRGGSSWMLVHAFDVFYFQAGVVSLSVLVGGTMRRLQHMRGSARVAA